MAIASQSLPSEVVCRDSRSPL